MLRVPISWMQHLGLAEGDRGFLWGESHGPVLGGDAREADFGLE